MEPRQCYVCFGEEGVLEQRCRCNNLIHPECLDVLMRTTHSHATQCAVCLTSYRDVEIVRMRRCKWTACAAKFYHILFVGTVLWCAACATVLWCVYNSRPYWWVRMLAIIVTSMCTGTVVVYARWCVKDKLCFVWITETVETRIRDATARVVQVL